VGGSFPNNKVSSTYSLLPFEMACSSTLFAYPGAEQASDSDDSGWEESRQQAAHSEASRIVDGEVARSGMDNNPAQEEEQGWAAFRDDEGRIYFHHAGTGVTQWERPQGFEGQPEEDED